MKQMASTFRNFFLLILVLGLVASCIQNQTPRSLRESAKAGSGSSPGGNSNGQNAGPGENGGGTVGDVVDDILKNGKVELRHIVNPYSATYESKVSIPKNFTGTLYLSGLNISSLNKYFVSVRFNFGRDLEVITVPATIARASGITPQTDMEVLVLRMKDRPFEKMRLLYDLYDYNTYTSTQTPTTDPKNVGLFCRGLKLAHDPTFQGNLSNTACDQAGERCLYAYAKVVDSGLYYNSSGSWLAKNPSSAQVDESATTYASHVSSVATALTKCLPDNLNATNFSGVIGLTATNTVANLSWDKRIWIGGTEYSYRGPYRPISQKLWAISGTALTSTYGLAASNLVSTEDPLAFYGYNSYLFPRAAKRQLRSGIQYWGSTDPFSAVRGLLSLSSAGTSDYMDGCNARLVNVNDYSPESVSACNVSGTIQIVIKDPKTGTETVVSTSSEVKLQLVRASETDSYGDEVIYTSMNSCNNSYACGSEQCCLNSRCWSKNYVSQCSEDTSPVGNLGTGETCKSDYDCLSLCCNQTTNTCQVHINKDTEKVLCQKSYGQQCVAKEWCMQTSVAYVKKVKTKPTGCTLHTFECPTFGDCKNGVCVAPVTPTPDTLDPANPDCSDAIEASSFTCNG